MAGGNPLSDCRTGFLSVLGTCNFSCSDGPYRLIRHDQLRHLVSAQAGQAAVELAARVLDMVACLPYLECFPDAENGSHLVPEHRLHLGVDQRVAFGVVLPPLRVACQDIATAE